MGVSIGKLRKSSKLWHCIFNRLRLCLTLTQIGTHFPCSHVIIIEKWTSTFHHCATVLERECSKDNFEAIYKQQCWCVFWVVSGFWLPSRLCAGKEVRINRPDRPTFTPAQSTLHWGNQYAVSYAFPSFNACPVSKCLMCVYVRERERERVDGMYGIAFTPSKAYRPCSEPLMLACQLLSYFPSMLPCKHTPWRLPT